MALGPLAAVLPWQNPREENARNRYYGAHLGFVRDRNDPAKLGRVRIHLPSLLGPENVPDHWSDWAYPMSGGLNIPPLDAPVVVFFEQGFVTHPFYTHGWFVGSNATNSTVPEAGKEADDPTWLQQQTVSPGGTGITGVDFNVTLPADTATNPETRPKYPYNKTLKTESGAIVELDDTPDGMARFRYRHPKGLTILVDTDGSVHFRDGGAYYFNPGGDFAVGLKAGSTFKVVYPGGTSMVLGGMGFHVKGHQTSLLGRTVQRAVKDL
jgi:hypothetical protein